MNRIIKYGNITAHRVKFGISIAILGASLVTGCGSGGSSTGEPSPSIPGSTQPGTTSSGSASTSSMASSGGGSSYSSGNSAAYSEQGCNQNADYQWQDGECVLSNNTGVINVHALDQLDSKDRSQLIAWLASPHKLLDVHQVLDPCPGNENNNTDSDADTVLDIELTRERLGKKPYFTSNNSVVFINKIHKYPYSGTQTQLDACTRSTNDVVHFQRDIEWVLRNEHMDIYVFDELVYSFTAAQSFELGRSFRETSELEQSKLNPNNMHSQEQLSANSTASHARLAFSFMPSAISKLLRPGTQERQSFGQLLDIPSDLQQSLVTLAESPPSANRVEFLHGDDFSAIARNDAYFEKSTAQNTFITPDIDSNLPAPNIAFKAFSKPNDVGYGFTTDDIIIEQEASIAYYTDTSLLDWQTNGWWYPIPQSIRGHSHTLKTSSDYDSTVWFHNQYSKVTQSPDPEGPFDQRVDPAQIFSSFTSLLALNDRLKDFYKSDKTLEVMLLAARRDYTSEDTSEGAPEAYLRSWSGLLTDFIYKYASYTSTQDESSLKESLLEVTTHLYDLASDHPTIDVTDFYAAAFSAFEQTIEPLSEELIATYGKKLLDYIFTYGYYYQNLDQGNLSQALEVTGLEYSETFSPLLTIGSFNENRSAIARVPEQLTNEIKALITQHDELTDNDDFWLKPKFLQLNTNQQTSGYIEGKIATLEATAAFKNRLQGVPGAQYRYDKSLEEISEQAYQENWTAADFARFELFLPNIANLVETSYLECETEPTLPEMFSCISIATKIEEYINNIPGEGYIAAYGDEENPFTTQLEQWTELANLLRSISREDFELGYESNRTTQKAFESQGAAGCSAEQIRTKLSRLIDIAKNIEQAATNPLPDFTEQYNKERDLLKQYETTWENCELSE